MACDNTLIEDLREIKKTSEGAVTREEMYAYIRDDKGLNAPVYRGAHDVNSTYISLDTVEDSGIYYEAKKYVPAGVALTDSEYWKRQNAPVYRGNHDINSTYISLDMVEESGIYYQAKKYVSAGVSLVNSEYWLVVKDKNTGDITQNRGMIALSFDDGFESIFDVADLMESKGVRCGFAVHYTALREYDTRVGMNDLRDLQSRGFEIINHSTTHPNFLTISLEEAKQEVSQMYKKLTSGGINVKGFVTSNSNATQAQINYAIKPYSTYAYTEYSGDYRDGWRHDDTAIVPTEFDMGRGKIWDGATGIDHLDEIAINRGLGSFYEHDVTTSDLVTLGAFLDRAIELGIEIVTPYQMVHEMKKRRGLYETLTPYPVQKNIEIQRTKAVVYAGVETVIHDRNTEDFIVSGTTGDVGFTVYLDDPRGETSAEHGNTFTIYAEVSSGDATSATFHCGILVYDNGGTELANIKPTTSISIDSTTRKISFTTDKIVNASTFKVRPYVNISNAEAGNLYNISLSYYKGAELIENVNKETLRVRINTFSIPNNTFTQVNIQDTESRFLSITGNNIVAKDDIDVELSLTMSAEALVSDVISRGVVKISVDELEVKSDNTLLSSKWVDWNTSLNITLRKGDTLKIEGWQALGETVTVTGNIYDNLNIKVTKN